MNNIIEFAKELIEQLYAAEMDAYRSTSVWPNDESERDVRRTIARQNQNRIETLRTLMREMEETQVP